jgi:hypothetical protein
MKAIKIFATLFVAVALFVACEPNTPNTPDTPNTEVTDSTTTQEPEAVAITVKAKVPAAWTNEITVWVWPTGGEGSEATTVKEGDWYVYTAAEGVTELNIIFKNGAGWNGDANQTVDITGIKENTCLELESDGATKATFVNVDCE